MGFAGSLISAEYSSENPAASFLAEGFCRARDLRVKPKITAAVNAAIMTIPSRKAKKGVISYPSSGEFFLFEHKLLDV
jgi:hypothetical protein